MAKEARKKEREAEKKSTSEKPVSLYPLTRDEALKKLLQVQPPKKHKEKTKKKRRKKERG